MDLKLCFSVHGVGEKTEKVAECWWAAQVRREGRPVLPINTWWQIVVDDAWNTTKSKPYPQRAETCFACDSGSPDPNPYLCAFSTAVL